MVPLAHAMLEELTSDGLMARHRRCSSSTAATFAVGLNMAILTACEAAGAQDVVLARRTCEAGM